MTSQPVDPSANAAQTPVVQRTIKVRRAPKFVPFMIAGALAGVVTAAIFTVLAPGGEEYDASSIFGFFTVLLMVPGASLGAVVALLIDRQSVRRAKTAVLESIPDTEGDTDAGQKNV